MTQARIRIEPELAALSRSQWEKLIYEANLGAEGSDLATRYFIDRQCQIDIAIDKDVDRKTISRRILEMKRQLISTYKRNITS